MNRPLDTFPISSRLISFKTEKAFLLKADGKGMEPNIKNKDLLICESSSTFKDGEFVVIQDEKKLKIRKASRQAGGLVILQTMNQKNASAVLESELKVIGIVRQALRNL